MSDTEYTVNFGSDKSIQFVKLSMAEIEYHGARLGEKIIRCKDCIFKAYDGNWCYRTAHEFMIKPDGFCSWAERR